LIRKILIFLSLLPQPVRACAFYFEPSPYTYEVPLDEGALPENDPEGYPYIITIDKDDYLTYDIEVFINDEIDE